MKRFREGRSRTQIAGLTLPMAAAPRGLPATLSEQGDHAANSTDSANASTESVHFSLRDC